MNISPLSARRRGRWLRVSQLVLMSAAAVTATALGISAFSSSAQAADPGPGYRGSAGYVGAARYEGRNAYCIDFDIPNPIGASTRVLGDGETLPERISKLDDLTRSQLHWVIDEYSATDDASTAAAVTIFVWSLIEPTRYGGDERPIASVPPEERDHVRQLLAGLRAEVANVTVGAELQVPSAELTLVASDDGSRVRLTVGDVPQGALLTARIDGAVVLPEGAATTGASTDETSSNETAATSESSAEIVIGQATSVLLQPTGDAVHVTLTASRQANAWTPSMRILLTEGRQTLIQSVPESPAPTQLDISVPPQPTPPPSTPPVTTPAVETPPVVETTNPPVTPPTVETTTPPAPSPETPHTSTSPAVAPTTPSQLATTGASGHALMTGIGMGFATLGCGGWLVSRRRYQPERSDAQHSSVETHQ